MKMNLKGGNVLSALFVIGVIAFFTACERDYNTIGVDLVDEGDINASKVTYDVFAYNRKLNGVRTNGLSSYLLGEYTHPVYGVSKTSFAAQLSLTSGDPVFGSNSQSTENSSADEAENERVTAVYLNIPFFSTALTDTTDLGEEEPKPYRVDSIVGNRDAAFTLRVNEYTKYLRDLDPESNFQESQEYFSDEDPAPYVSTVLFDETYELDETEILFFDDEDDPDTEDVDESAIPSERLTPRIRVALDSQFFQEKILDNEGQSVLTSQSNFKEFLRGIYISAEMPNSDLAMLLNVNSAYVEIEYDYDSTTDGETTVESSTYRLPMSGNKINYINESAYPQSILDQFNDANASRLYVNGAAGSYAELNMLGGAPDVTTAFQEAKEQGWLINEANLIFYVDKSALSEESDITLPPRMYLYDLGNGRTLTDYSRDLVGNTGVDSTSYSVYGGILDEDNDVGPRYKFRLTEYVNDIVRNDSTNVKLGLTTTNNIANILNVSAFNQEEEIELPQASITNLYGTVFYGNNVPASEDESKLQLEIYYTETKSN
ncbi:DUF4270 domain-containing protein [Joostella atrarenae]|uniref:DUF4270 domain-containing protein n=2 Tax=Joostella atrarenae TaxID=679257 RepID=A0ABS9J0E5_9FLAO|nr:DUF4270 domain-containing protein [Joostella atrarenae]